MVAPTTKNRRPLRWTHTAEGGQHIYTYTCDCNWGLEAMHIKRNHWTLQASVITEDELMSADWNNYTYESYTSVQNEAQRRIIEHSRLCAYCRTIYTRPQPTDPRR